VKDHGPDRRCLTVTAGHQQQALVARIVFQVVVHAAAEGQRGRRQLRPGILAQVVKPRFRDGSFAVVELAIHDHDRFADIRLKRHGVVLVLRGPLAWRGHEAVLARGGDERFHIVAVLVVSEDDQRFVFCIINAVCVPAL